MNQELTEFDALLADVQIFLAPIKDVKVVNAESSTTALTAAKRVKELKKILETKRDDMVRPLNDRVDAINAYCKKIRVPLDAAESALKRAVTTYDQEQEVIRQAELRRLEEERLAKERAIEEERRKKEEADRKAREKEEKRIAAELKAKAELERQEREEAEAMFGKATAADKKKDDEVIAAMVAQADAERKERHDAAERAKAEESARLMREKEERDRVNREHVRAVEEQRVKNIKKLWKFDILDAQAVPRQYLMVDDRLIREAISIGAREIPGVRIFQEAVLAVR